VSATAIVSAWEYAARLFEPKPRLYSSPLALARHLDPRTGVSAALHAIDQALVDLVDTDEHDALLVTILRRKARVSSAPAGSPSGC
jgi:hypothetical protein